MMLHLDGSRHRWFQDNRWYLLIEVLDDATSETFYAQMVDEDSTRTVMAALREVIEQKGRAMKPMPRTTRLRARTTVTES